MKNRIFVIEHNVYESETIIAIGVSDKKLLRWIKKNTDLKVSKSMVSMGTKQGIACMSGIFTMIRLHKWNGTPENHGALAHEAFHIAEFILERCGVIYDMHTRSEAFAYMVGSTVRHVLDHIEGD
jgi:hypothetical protein